MVLDPNLIVVFEAARQAGRGRYTPNATVVAALAVLSGHSPAARLACKKLWRACSLHRLIDVNQTTTDHLRGLDAQECWRRLAAELGVEVTRPVLLEFYAATRTPAERHPQNLTTPRWL